MFSLVKACTISVITARDAVKILFFWWETFTFFLLCLWERTGGNFLLKSWLFLLLFYFYIFFHLWKCEKKNWKIPFSGETEWTFLFLCVKPWKIKFSQDFFYFFIVRLSNLIDHKRLNFFGFMHEIKKCPEKNIYIFPLSHKKFCWFLFLISFL